MEKLFLKYLRRNTVYNVLFEVTQMENEVL